MEARSRLDDSLVDGPIRPAVWKLTWPTIVQNFVAGVQGVIDQCWWATFSDSRATRRQASDGG